MPPRWAARRDSNEKIIIDALEKAGASVVQLNMENVCDLLVGFRSANYLLEVKTERGKLRAGQREFIDNWHGQAAVVRSWEQALEVIGAIG